MILPTYHVQLFADFVYRKYEQKPNVQKIWMFKVSEINTMSTHFIVLLKWRLKSLENVMPEPDNGKLSPGILNTGELNIGA